MLEVPPSPEHWTRNVPAGKATIAPTVKRMQRIEPDGGSSTDARVVQVEIVLDDPSGMPQVLGRETRVTFL